MVLALGMLRSPKCSSTAFPASPKHTRAPLQALHVSSCGPAAPAHPSGYRLCGCLVRTAVSSDNRSRGALHLRQVASESADPVYQGAYGSWTLTPADRNEVFGYRLGLSVAGVAILLSTLAALLPASGPTQQLHDVLQTQLDPLAVAGAAGLGCSLFLIHIYVDVLKKALQVLWAVGSLGGVYLLATQDVPAAAYVAQHPTAVWLVGPLFAAITGIAFKEGLCYGKAEAAALFITVPLLLGGHLLQILPSQAEEVLLAAFALLFTIFAARKWTQPVKDDLGDKSVFEFLKQDANTQEEMRAARASREEKQQ